MSRDRIAVAFAAGLVVLVSLLGVLGPSPVGSAQGIERGSSLAVEPDSNRLCAGSLDLQPGTYAAVVDRLEGELAVLVIESRSRAAAAIIAAACLPETSRVAGAVVAVEVSHWAVEVRHVPKSTHRRSTSADRRFDRLADRPA